MRLSVNFKTGYFVVVLFRRLFAPTSIYQGLPIRWVTSIWLIVRGWAFWLRPNQKLL